MPGALIHGKVWVREEVTMTAVPYRHDPHPLVDEPQPGPYFAVPSPGKSRVLDTVSEPTGSPQPLNPHSPDSPGRITKPLPWTLPGPQARGTAAPAQQ